MNIISEIFKSFMMGIIRSRLGTEMIKLTRSRFSHKASGEMLEAGARITCWGCVFGGGGKSQSCVTESWGGRVGG